ncbi:unnamed protein product [Rotaria sordida]|uniref:non-specific serine/threonine protein kinase n=1 Tax=Rotaria sordida TaxID=392033 RepID=A0A813U8D6_9BILA|nr:unnamed protein product [Rotaria sordida]
MLNKQNASEPSLSNNLVDVNEKYKFLKKIGKGSYGEVWLVSPNSNSSSIKSHIKQYVLKRLDLHSSLNNPLQNDIENAEREAKLLSTLKHPNIVSYIESFRSNDGFLNIVMTYCEGGDLFTKLKEKKINKESLTENQIIEWFIQICMALQLVAYRLYTIVPCLVKYIHMSTNWYVKLDKKRFKGETTLEDCLVSLNVLCYILLTMAKLRALFTPFLAKYIYQILRKLMTQLLSSSSQQEISVQFQVITKSQKTLVNKDIERAVAVVQTVIGLGRTVRERKIIPMKYPLPEFVLIHKDVSVLRDVQSLEDFVREVCLILLLSLTFIFIIKGLNVRESESPLTTIDDVSIESEDVHIVYRVAKQTQFEATTEQGFVVLLDYTAEAS